MDERDWSDGFPSELIHLVSKKLPDITDFVRFRFVCKTWRLATTLSDPPPQLPWLVEFQQSTGNFRFYSITSGKTYTIHFGTSFKMQYFYGNSRGCILAYKCGDRGSFNLFNPVTNHRVPLPSVNLAYRSPACMSSNSNPLQSEEYVVASGSLLSQRRGILRDIETRMLSFWRPGEDKWIYKECPLGSYAYRQQCSVIYKGKYLIMECNSKVTAIDIATLTLAYVIPPFEYKKFCDIYLVESSGKILRIDKFKDESTGKYTFSIYKLDDGKRKNFGLKPVWIKIDSVGDDMLFLGFKHGISVTSTEFVGAGLRGNCIYYLDETRYNPHLHRYNIEEQTTEKLHCPINAFTWFVPTF